MTANTAESTALVSVIIPLYNQERFIAATLDSVLAQDYAAFEVLVADDGSTDGSLAIAEDYASHHPDRIRVLRHEGGVNRGVSATRNLALREARGEWSAFLDSDDLWYPGKLSQQMAFIQDHPETMVCYTLSDVIREGRGEEFIPDEDILGSHPLPPRPRDLFLQILLVQVNDIFSTVVVRTGQLREIGGFEENLPFQCEDRIMVARMATYGSVTCLPEVLCSYRAHDTSYTSSVLASRTWPAIFYDGQVRLMVALFRTGHRKEWAHDIARYILPVSVIRAAACSVQPRILGRVFLDFLWSLRYAPWIPVFMGMKLASFVLKGHIFTRGGDYIKRTALWKTIFGRQSERKEEKNR